MKVLTISPGELSSMHKTPKHAFEVEECHIHCESPLKKVSKLHQPHCECVLVGSFEHFAKGVLTIFQGYGEQHDCRVVHLGETNELMSVSVGVLATPMSLWSFDLELFSISDVIRAHDLAPG